MAEFTIEDAGANLSGLIDASLAGVDVVICDGATPLVRLTPIRQSKFKVGMWKSELASSAPDFLAPMSDKDLCPWEGSF